MRRSYDVACRVGICVIGFMSGLTTKSFILFFLCHEFYTLFPYFFALSLLRTLSFNTVLFSLKVLVKPVRIVSSRVYILPSLAILEGKQS